MAEKKAFSIPEWFPRNPLKAGIEQEKELREQWNRYLCIPKGNSARKLMLLDLKSAYGDAIVAFYAQSQPDKAVIEDIDEEEPSKEPVTPPELKHKRPRPVTPPPSLEPEPMDMVIAHTQSKSHYTPVQITMAEELAASCKKMAGKYSATLLDVRKAWDYWQAGNLYFSKK